MNMLAEANKASSGRWVLTPGKGERLMGVRERNRMRARRRRRVVFTGLLEITLLSLIVGLFPPLRAMLYATATLAAVLLCYVALLIAVRSGEARRARERRLRMARRRMATEASPYRGASNGHANGYRANGIGVGVASSGGRAHGPSAANRATAYGRGPNGNGSGASAPNGHGSGNGHGYGSAPLWEEMASDGEIRIIEDDVHVIVRRASDVDVAALQAAGQ